ncbi:hypothetical protein V8E52_000738 [Russula decolorans]
MDLLTALAIGTATTATGVALTPLVAPAMLGAIGFSAAGPVAGSFAAVLQAGTGNVAAGSMFAAAQSIAMGGGVPAVISAVGGLGAGALAAGAAVAAAI